VNTHDPITEGFGRTPEGYPLGWPVADKVRIEPIKKRTANAIHTKYHSYVNTERHNSVVNHGIMLDGELVGAISYAYLLCSEPIAGYEPDEYLEVARVTVGIDMPNLASCAMSKSQDRFRETYASRHGISLLVTYVHEDWDGTMFSALADKGWTADGWSRGHQAGNRAENEIREVDKERWICDVTTD